MDEAHMKAQATRERNKAMRDAMRAERDAQERVDKALVLDALWAVLRDQEATSAQRLYAVAVLDHMQYYHFLPCGVSYPGQKTDVDLSKFWEELDKLK